ncbi:EAL domain-containing protein [Curvibacter sp. CHRR-16]|uniref:putative bifunctional diguanylate cyclase/phosphodiesterase n=1 Tax=Curvibacter sp. CHRR-16 TaxID=2835872 RepID=UPI001BDA4088|nr:EAL domain-containing protein [Curvibacter sp. CHRR-16]MBT0569300.1 EAL domain-containing protein [Curvibacter sp. CHRR-16]
MNSDQRLVRRILYIGAAIMCISGAGWAPVFASQDNYLGVLLDLLMLMCGVGVVLLTWASKQRAAFFILLGVCYAVIVLMSIFMDIPSAHAPRVAHNYLLVLSMCCMFILRQERPWLRNVMVAVPMITFVGFASTNWGIASGFTLPDDLRIWGAWVNTAFAVLAAYCIMFVLLSGNQAAFRLGQELRRGIENHEFVLYYQPQLNHQQKVVAVEALVRWLHPQQGLLGPAYFIQAAEKSGAILLLGRWVMEQAAQQLQHWSQNPTMRGVSLSVNVSVTELLRPSYVSGVKELLQLYAIEPARLKLEVTESVFAEDFSLVVERLTALREVGVGIALDDFGTGYSSLAYLKRMPVDQVKVDRSFVRDIVTDPHDQAIVASIVQLASSMGFSVVAEGVEIAAQRDALQALGCLQYQGYLFAQPMLLDDLLNYCQQHQS